MQASEADRLEFIREAETMLHLDHPNLVGLIGVCVQQAPWLIVLEFLEYGDVRSVLKACASKGVKLAFFEQLKWMVDIAAGTATASASTSLTHPPHTHTHTRVCVLCVCG